MEVWEVEWGFDENLAGCLSISCLEGRRFGKSSFFRVDLWKHVINLPDGLLLGHALL